MNEYTRCRCGQNVVTMSANDWIEKRTEQIAKEWKCSRPRPSNRRMGFKGKDYDFFGREKMNKK